MVRHVPAHSRACPVCAHLPRPPRVCLCFVGLIALNAFSISMFVLCFTRSRAALLLVYSIGTPPKCVGIRLLRRTTVVLGAAAAAAPRASTAACCRACARGVSRSLGGCKCPSLVLPPFQPPPTHQGPLKKNPKYWGGGRRVGGRVKKIAPLLKSDTMVGWRVHQLAERLPARSHAPPRQVDFFATELEDAGCTAEFRTHTHVQLDRAVDADGAPRPSTAASLSSATRDSARATSFEATLARKAGTTAYCSVYAVQATTPSRTPSSRCRARLPRRRGWKAHTQGTEFLAVRSATIGTLGEAVRSHLAARLRRSPQRLVHDHRALFRTAASSSRCSSCRRGRRRPDGRVVYRRARATRHPPHVLDGRRRPSAGTPRGAMCPGNAPPALTSRRRSFDGAPNSTRLADPPLRPYLPLKAGGSSSSPLILRHLLPMVLWHGRAIPRPCGLFEHLKPFVHSA